MAADPATSGPDRPLMLLQITPRLLGFAARVLNQVKPDISSSCPHRKLSPKRKSATAERGNNCSQFRYMLAVPNKIDARPGGIQTGAV
ncbi:hypothetical protein BaRGS_00037633 [Batillaria attramentaria]|uniref:Uncharacterized protein n=1 Tax=Batillaria attramentaria TaxID=370345 RepID=A0ABD0J896_9CAEN